MVILRFRRTTIGVVLCGLCAEAAGTGHDKPYDVPHHEHASEREVELRSTPVTAVGMATSTGWEADTVTGKRVRSL
jgi:hypothetical protein